MSKDTTHSFTHPPPPPPPHPPPPPYMSNTPSFGRPVIPDEFVEDIAQAEQHSKLQAFQVAQIFCYDHLYEQPGEESARIKDEQTFLDLENGPFFSELSDADYENYKPPPKTTVPSHQKKAPIKTLLSHTDFKPVTHIAPPSSSAPPELYGTGVADNTTTNEDYDEPLSPPHDIDNDYYDGDDPYTEIMEEHQFTYKSLEEAIKFSIQRAQATKRISQILGLEEVKRLLINRIAKPVANPKASEEFLSGSFDKKELIFLEGPEGSGKLTTVKAIARYVGARLCVVSRDIFLENSLTHCLSMCWQSKTKRAILYFDHCSDKLEVFTDGRGTMMHGAKSANELIYCITHPVDLSVKTWIIVGSDRHRTTLYNRLFEWVGKSHAYANPPNRSDRKKWLQYLIRKHLRAIRADPIPKEQLKKLVSWIQERSKYATYHNIMSYLFDVFRRPKDRISFRDFQHLVGNEPELIPVMDDFVYCAYGSDQDRNQRITSAILRTSERLEAERLESRALTISANERSKTSFISQAANNRRDYHFNNTNHRHHHHHPYISSSTTATNNSPAPLIAMKRHPLSQSYGNTPSPLDQGPSKRPYRVSSS